MARSACRNPGNGRAAAILLARAGAAVVAVDRKLDLAERTVEMISAEGGTESPRRPLELVL